MSDSDKQPCTKPERLKTSLQQPITCPAPVLDFLHQKFLGDESTSSSRPRVLQHVEEAQSAQQQVLILTLRRDIVFRFQQMRRPNHTDDPTNRANGDDGDPLVTIRDDHDLVVATDEDWQQALSDGDAKLVVRLWKHGSRWWNLHQRSTNSEMNNSTTEESADEATATLLLAASELAGYRLARRSLPHLRIPRVLATGKKSRKSTYRHYDPQTDTDSFAWAIMEYVGETSTLFQPIQYGKEQRSTSSLSSSLDDSWTRGMIKGRDEFGFSEPHPRWGRVPTVQALDYAKTVLGQVTIPLHRAMNESRRNGESDDALRLLTGLCGYQVRDSTRKNDEPANCTITGYTYQTMVELYQQAYAKMQVTYSQMVNNDEQLLAAIQNLGRALHYLQDDAQSLQPPTLPPVLVHMDCQPQNLLFLATACGTSSTTNIESSLLPRVASVLDWEEAAFADPRFELLMLCRKVVANREQADLLWEMYQTKMNDGQAAATGSEASRGGPLPHQQQPLSLGPIEPWLHLETVHSLTTLLLQSMDLLGGGRSPWETKPDLWGKIDREFQRLMRSGWDELATLSTTT